MTRHRDATGAELTRLFDNSRVYAAEAHDFPHLALHIEAFGEELTLRVELRLDRGDLRCFCRRFGVTFVHLQQRHGESALA